MVSLLRPSPSSPHEHPVVSVPLLAVGASSLALPSASRERPWWGAGRQTDRQTDRWGRVGDRFQVAENSGHVSTEMQSPRFLLKIYYKKTQLGEGHLPLSVLRAGGWGWDVTAVTAGHSRPPAPGCAAAAGRGAQHSRSSAPPPVASGARCPSAAARPP